MPLYSQDAVLANVGTIELSPVQARLRATLRNEGANGLVLDLKLQIASDKDWVPTKQMLRIEADRLPDLVNAIERAIELLPDLG